MSGNIIIVLAVERLLPLFSGQWIGTVLSILE